ncbi:MAG: helix-turn-helix domain-containing protein [Candidatus Neomarinimicrobiota bacterium]|nr:helix-turn-helix domain-containing protein [Candidatus Neomarinimicrobiota bacterium]
MKYLSSKDTANILGINISTLKRWTDSGKIKCEKTAGGHRKFTMQHIRGYYKSFSESSKNISLGIENKEQKFLYGLINDRDYKELAQNLAASSLKADELSVRTIVNGLYMNGVPIPDLLDYVIDVAGHIVELQLKTNKIDHTDAYLSRNVITRSVDSLNNDQPNGSFNGKNALCVNFEDNLPDIGVVMSEVLLRNNGFNVYNTGSHAELGDLKNIIKNRKINLLLFYLCDLQCCNAIVEKNINKTKNQIIEIVKLAKKINTKVIFGGEGLKLLKGVKNQISNSFLTYNDLSKII